MASLNVAHWYCNPSARSWRTSPPASPASFHRTLAGYQPTPLISAPQLAEELNVGSVWVKDESNRLGLPAFKILGASWATCRSVAEHLSMDMSQITVPQVAQNIRSRQRELGELTLVTATDGNHGRAVARMAKLLGVAARIYIPTGLSQAAISAIVAEGAELIVHDNSYDDVVEIAHASTENREHDILVQDTSWPGYVDIPRWIVEGYTTLFHEIDEALNAHGAVPTIVACPVGVGSLAHAMVDHYRSGITAPCLLSVEPVTAACVAESLLAGQCISVSTEAPTIMAGLNCGTPSEIGWPSLLSGVDAAVSITDAEARTAVNDLAALGIDVGPCGAAPLAGTRAALKVPERRRAMNVDRGSAVVLVSTEGRAANPIEGR